MEIQHQFKAILWQCKDLTVIVHFMSLIGLTIGLSQPQHVRIGTIEFFGTSGIDVQRARSVLPMHEQDALSEEQLPAIRNRLIKAIENAIGHAPTDVSLVCCNEQQNLMVYVGLGGNNTAKISVLPPPKGSNPQNFGRNKNLSVSGFKRLTDIRSKSLALPRLASMTL